MANTYHQIYLQTVFAVKYRHAVIDKEWSSKLFGVIWKPDQRIQLEDNYCK